MSNLVRSLEDAVEHISSSLHQQFDANTICVYVNDGLSNRLHKVSNLHELIIDSQSLSSYLLDYYKAVNDSYPEAFCIADVLQHPLTSRLCNTIHIGQASFCGVALKSAANELYGFIGIFDRTNRHYSKNQLVFLQSQAALLSYMIELENTSVTDSLTGLYNRRYLTHLHYQNSADQLSVIFIDIDDFKLVNDTYGHDVGDWLLYEIANRLKQSVHKSDILIRYGGDEFLVCCEQVLHADDAERLANNIKETLAPPYDIQGNTICISASVGFSASDNQSTLQQLITTADQAMYGIKQSAAKAT